MFAYINADELSISHDVCPESFIFHELQVIF